MHEAQPRTTGSTRRDFLRRAAIAAAAGPILAADRTLAEGESESEFVITDYGAAPDGEGLNTEAIQATLDACHETGGGTVRVPEGRFRTGALDLKSNVRLHLEEGAVLEGSDDWRDYQGSDAWRSYPWRDSDEWGGGEWLDGLITAHDAMNVRIDGSGVIDGVDCEKPHGEEGFRGPHAIVFHSCADFALAEFTVKRAGNYAIICRDSTDARLIGVRARGGHDALHTQSCSRFNVRGCDFRTGDDCFAGCDNTDFVIRDCRINSSCNGFRLGCLNLRVADCELWGPGEYEHKSSGRTNMLAAFVHFAPRDRDPKLPSDNWRIENLTIDRADAVYRYDFENGGWQQGQPAKRLRFERIRATDIARPVRIVGDGDRQLELRMKDVSIALREESRDQPVIEIRRFGTLYLSDVTLENSGERPVLRAIEGNAAEIEGLTAVPGSDRPYVLERVDAVDAG